MALVFVYGTLLRAGANHSVLVDLGARFVCEATTSSVRILVDLGPYPALLPSASSFALATTCVVGEVFEVDDAAIAVLDEFEGAPTLYTRETIALTASDGSSVSAYVYELARTPPARARPIANGRYLATGVVLPHGADPDQIEGD
jgi:gamma-glutamylcyclotransferase (GGCT)/AIG2-like uncharacterized protein YtfP